MSCWPCPRAATPATSSTPWSRRGGAGSPRSRWSATTAAAWRQSALPTAWWSPAPSTYLASRRRRPPRTTRCWSCLMRRADPIVRAGARVEGVVQGVGFRPYVHRLAGELGLSGWVLNDERGVLLEVEGPGEAVDSFLVRLPREAPPLASVEKVTRS